MGANSTKKEILKTLEYSTTNSGIYNEKKIEYKINYKSNLDEDKNPSSDKKEKENEENEDDDSFVLSDGITQVINNPLLDVKNTTKFPYGAIGTISVQFPVREEIFVYTCFLIDANIVVTLASNLKSNSKGGKAKSIVTSFSKEKVKWDNIFIQGEEILNENDEEDKNQIDSLDNLSSKLAVIIYDNNISKEWLGVEEGKKADFEGKDVFAVFSFKEENECNTITIDEKDKNKKSKLREIIISNMNPFFNANIKGEKNNIKLITQSPGSPLYYRDYNNGAYVIAIITENFEFQYFDRKTMKFLIKMINKANQIKKKLNKDIEDYDIVQLNLEGKNLGQSDIIIINIDFKISLISTIKLCINIYLISNLNI